MDTTLMNGPQNPDPAAAAPPMAAPAAPDDPNGQDRPEDEQKLVQKLLKKIKRDKEHHKKAFEQMRKDMKLARTGRQEGWPEDNYVANITGRIVRQKTASLYAKNPKATAQRQESLDFTVWDENPDTLRLAFGTVQQAQQAAAAPPPVDPTTGAPVVDPATGLTPQPQLPPGFQQARATIADFQNGVQTRQKMDRVGRTLEILYANMLRNQKPLDFKIAMKKVVRRACTTGVGYVEVGFQRETGTPPEVLTQLSDARTRLDHLSRLVEEASEGEIENGSAEMAELQASIEALQNEPDIVLSEGLVFDYPQSTKVIPDKLCKSLVGFVGARHITVEYLFTTEEVEEMFPGVDLEQGFTKYDATDDSASAVVMSERGVDGDDLENRDAGMVRVYKHYDKPSGLVYYLAEGYKGYLRAPAPPDVFVSDFWPVYALTFNDTESEDDLFPPSDVELVRSMQTDHNRSRQGKREHRKAARPRWFYAKGTVDDPDAKAFANAKPFSATPINLAPNQKVGDLFDSVKVPGVDPNLYDTGEIFADVQLVVGQQEASLGGVARATATESAIAANSTASSDESSVDDLDGFLTLISRASGQILFREMSEQQVQMIVGPGALWPTADLSEIANGMYLEIEAGSSGKPNQAVEINNWQKLLPFLIQIPGINPTWMARETVKRLDDKVDLTQAIAAGVPSVVMQNAGRAPVPANPQNAPAAQGGQGADNGPRPPPASPGGSGPAFGSNQVP